MPGAGASKSMGRQLCAGIGKKHECRIADEIMPSCVNSCQVHVMMRVLSVRGGNEAIKYVGRCRPCHLNCDQRQGSKQCHHQLFRRCCVHPPLALSRQDAVRNSVCLGYPTTDLRQLTKCAFATSHLCKRACPRAQSSSETRLPPRPPSHLVRSRYSLAVSPTLLSPIPLSPRVPAFRWHTSRFESWALESKF